MPKYLRFPVVAVIASCYVFFKAGDETSIHNARGDEHYRNFDNYGALVEYRKAYETDPQDFETLFRMARIHNDIGRSMLRRNDSAEVWYLEAIEYAQRMVDLHPDRCESYFWLAVTKGSLIPFKSPGGKLDIGKEVTQYALESIAVDSTFGPSYMVLGIIYREADRLKWYERLIANVVFGGSLPGTIEESEAMLLKSIHLDPLNMFAYYELSRTYGQMGKTEQQKEMIEKILTLTPMSLREQEQQQRAQRQLARLMAPRQE